MALCPVCSTEVAEKKTPGAGKGVTTSTYEGKDYYFCSKACKKKFDESPEKFIKK